MRLVGAMRQALQSIPNMYTGPATTGIPDLDRALGGLFWGDNVVWEARNDADTGGIYRALAAQTEQADAVAYVNLTRDPADVAADYPGATVLDARPGTDLERPGALLTAARTFGMRHSRSVLLFDPLDAMAAQWDVELARRFFARCCPLLLDLGAIAYWSVTGAEALANLRREVEQVTQCVVVLDGHRVRIAKADGRPPGTEGMVYSYEPGGAEPTLKVAPATSRLASALKALRTERGLSQGDLARIAGVSPSAISHAERGQSGLSLDTIVDLATKLGITIDDLLRGEDGPGYRLARRHDPRERATAMMLPLLDDLRTGLRIYLVRLAPKAAGSSPVQHKGIEAVAVASGLVQIELGHRRAALRSGEALIAERATITAWRNVGESDATLFFVLRDPIADPIA
jgi:transcriptional regulator with XRE-family HTH domain